MSYLAIKTLNLLKMICPKAIVYYVKYIGTFTYILILFLLIILTLKTVQLCLFRPIIIRQELHILE